MFALVSRWCCRFSPWHSFSTNTPDSDHDLLRINFDITLPRISCQYASVDIDDVMGRRRENVTQNVMKWTIDADTGDFKAYANSVPVEPQFRHSTSLCSQMSWSHCGCEAARTC